MLKKILLMGLLSVMAFGAVSSELKKMMKIDKEEDKNSVYPQKLNNQLVLNKTVFDIEDGSYYYHYELITKTPELYESDLYKQKTKEDLNSYLCKSKNQWVKSRLDNNANFIYMYKIGGVLKNQVIVNKSNCKKYKNNENSITEREANILDKGISNSSLKDILYIVERQTKRALKYQPANALIIIKNIESNNYRKEFTTDSEIDMVGYIKMVTGINNYKTELSKYKQEDLEEKVKINFNKGLKNKLCSDKAIEYPESQIIIKGGTLKYNYYEMQSKKLLFSFQLDKNTCKN